MSGRKNYQFDLHVGNIVQYINLVNFNYLSEWEKLTIVYPDFTMRDIFSFSKTNENVIS